MKLLNPLNINEWFGQMLERIQARKKDKPKTKEPEATPSKSMREGDKLPEAQDIDPSLQFLIGSGLTKYDAEKMLGPQPLHTFLVRHVDADTCCVSVITALRDSPKDKQVRHFLVVGFSKTHKITLPGGLLRFVHASYKVMRPHESRAYESLTELLIHLPVEVRLVLRPNSGADCTVVPFNPKDYEEDSLTSLPEPSPRPASQSMPTGEGPASELHELVLLEMQSQRSAATFKEDLELATQELVRGFMSDPETPMQPTAPLVVKVLSCSHRVLLHGFKYQERLSDPTTAFYALVKAHPGVESSAHSDFSSEWMYRGLHASSIAPDLTLLLSPQTSDQDKLGVSIDGGDSFIKKNYKPESILLSNWQDVVTLLEMIMCVSFAELQQSQHGSNDSDAKDHPSTTRTSGADVKKAPPVPPRRNKALSDPTGLAQVENTPKIEISQSTMDVDADDLASNTTDGDTRALGEDESVNGAEDIDTAVESEQEMAQREKRHQALQTSLEAAVMLTVEVCVCGEVCMYACGGVCTWGCELCRVRYVECTVQQCAMSLSRNTAEISVCVKTWSLKYVYPRPYRPS